MFGKGLFAGFQDKRRFHDSLIGCFRTVMVFNDFGSDSFFRDKFYGRTEEVVKEVPLVTVEVV